MELRHRPDPDTDCPAVNLKTHDLPDITNRQSLNEVWVDSTPNGGYAIRILEAYRRKCDSRWVLHGANDATNALYEQMNEDQEKRAHELDEAIEWLRGGN